MVNYQNKALYTNIVVDLIWIFTSAQFSHCLFYNQVKESEERESTLHKQLQQSSEEVEARNASIVRLEDKLKVAEDEADTAEKQLSETTTKLSKVQVIAQS